MFFGVVRSEVNKWQNRQSQSWFGPPDTALHRDVLQLEPYDASLWLFSVNSALSRPSILPSCLMSQQSLPSQPPSPTYLYNPSTLFCYTVFFSLSVKLEGNGCLLNKAKTAPFSHPCQFHWRHFLAKRDEPPHCPVFSTLSWVHVRRLPAHGRAHLKCWPATFLSTLIPFFIAHSPTSGNEDCTTARWCVSQPIQWLSGHFIILMVWSRVDR